MEKLVKDLVAAKIPASENTKLAEVMILSLVSSINIFEYGVYEIVMGVFELCVYSKGKTPIEIAELFSSRYKSINPLVFLKNYQDYIGPIE